MYIKPEQGNSQICSAHLHICKGGKNHSAGVQNQKSNCPFKLKDTADSNNLHRCKRDATGEW